MIGELATLPFASVAQLRTRNPRETALMRQRIDEAAGTGKRLRIVQKWIPLSKIPREVIDAVIVAEDGTFYAHGGIDWFEVQESVEKDLKEGRAARGASTITQQLAKNLYLSTSKDPVRKIRELLITLMLEHELTKNRILELYLNVVEWGNGIFGIDAASRAYFGKSASDLTLDEATRLAAVIPSPLRHPANGDGRYVLRRKQIVLDRMMARNFVPLTTEEDTQAIRPETDTTHHPAVDSAASPQTPVDTSDTSATDEGDDDGL